MKRLDLQFTERARAWITKHLSNYESEAVLLLSYGTLTTYDDDGVAKNGKSTRWRFVVFTKAQAEEIEKTSSLTGEGVYVAAGGVKLCIPEPKDLKRLSGRTLDAVDGELLVNERAS